jgi:hypothetical protein
MSTRVPGVGRTPGVGRVGSGGRAARGRWWERIGPSTYARDNTIARMTILCTGARCRPNPADASVAVCDYPVGGEFHLKLIDTRTGHTIKEITKDRGGLPQYSNGNGCWNPAGTHIIFQVQAGVNAFYPVGRDPGWGTGCNFYDYNVATDTLTALTADTFPTTVETQWARFQPIIYSATGLIYTYRYLDQPGTDGGGRWQLRTATYTAATPALSSDAAYLDPSVPGWGYYIAPFGLFPADHATFPNRVLVAGTLDSLTQSPRHMKLYAVVAPSTKTKFAAVVHEDAWNEGCAIAPDGTVWMASNGNGILHESSDLENEVTTREYQQVAADGSTYTEYTGFNLSSQPEYVGDDGESIYYGVANMQHSAFTSDGRTVFAGLVVKNAAATVIGYRVVKVELA